MLNNAHRFKLGKAIFLFLVFSCITLFENTQAQQSIVPSYHPVYDWLYTQYVNGSIPSYSYETLPHRRVQILNQLKTIKKFASDLSKHDLSLLNEFLTEFDHTSIPFKSKEPDITQNKMQTKVEQSNANNTNGTTVAPHYQFYEFFKSPKSLLKTVKN